MVLSRPMLLKVTFSEEEVAALDAMRGVLPRATWVRQLVHRAAVASDALRKAQEPVFPAVPPEPPPASVPGVVRASELLREPVVDSEPFYEDGQAP